MKRWATIFLLLPTLVLAQRHDRHSNWSFQDSESLRRSFTGRKLTLDNISGYVHVTGGAGGTVEVSVAKHIEAESNAALLQAKQEVSLDMSQQGDTVRLYVDGPFRRRGGDNGHRGYEVYYDYDIQVPSNIELDLKTINAGDIVVKGTNGDFNINGLNGGIEMEQVSGSGNVHTLNGPVKVSFTRNPTKSTSFHSLNGSIEVHFQPGLNADLKYSTLNGGVYSDFDVTVAGDLSKGVDHRNMQARVGAGGLPLSFDTLNGSIKLYTK
jgi:hypothetical protein